MKSPSISYLRLARSNTELSETRLKPRGAASGIAVTLSGENMKVGAGYNFTDFSDDLTDLRYDHRGVFFNIIGTK